MVLSSIMGLFRDVARWKEVWNEEEGSAADALLYYLSFPFLEITVIEARVSISFHETFFSSFFFFLEGKSSTIVERRCFFFFFFFFFEVSIFGYSKRGSGFWILLDDETFQRCFVY